LSQCRQQKKTYGLVKLGVCHKGLCVAQAEKQVVLSKNYSYSDLATKKAAILLPFLLCFLKI
jgi:hypothetical protein